MHIFKEADIATSEFKNETIYMTSTIYISVLKRRARATHTGVRAPPRTAIAGLQSCLYAYAYEMLFQTLSLLFSVGSSGDSGGGS
jgi:hypothetical protein